MPISLDYETFENLKVDVERTTGFKCFETQPGAQTIWYGTTDKFDAFRVMVEPYIHTGSLALLLDGSTKKWSAFKKQWY